MQYAALSPVAVAETPPLHLLSRRLGTLEGKTIGLYATFKEHWMHILDEIGRQLQQRYDRVTLTRFRYRKILDSYTTVAEVAKDPEELPAFEEWIKTTDAVIVANADAGSCTLYLAYNASLVERLGKPGVLTVQTEFMPLAQSAVSLRGVPGMRMVDIGIHDLSMEADLDDYYANVLPGKVAAVIDQIIDALTGDLTEAEQAPPPPPAPPFRIAISGTLQQVNDYFYQQGWAPGSPIIPPTEEAVREMMAGCDLPPDHVVATIPPRNGKATIEKIAINAVMAGCLPLHMPVLVAAVKAITDPGMWVEAYTSSMASWMPLLIVNGPIRHDIAINSDTSYMSPYKRANACIGRALGLMIMNIAGIRAHIEDMGVMGHEGHFGVCIGENEEASPWEPLHHHYGIDSADSAVTVMFPNTRSICFGLSDAGAVLGATCDALLTIAMGYDPGCAVIFTPGTARVLAGAGLTRQAVTDYIVEYTRRPSSQVNVRWLRGNCHDLGVVPLPLDQQRSFRHFMSGKHLPIIVAGNAHSIGAALYAGGGDHGGPITKKIDLPGSWSDLVKRYNARN